MRSHVDDNGSYFVDFSEQVGEDLMELQQQASHRGQGKQFAAAFRRIFRALRRKPNSVGEPLYQLKALGLQVRTVVVAPLAIDFAIDEEHHVVYVQGGQL